jgi:hypothetical protein
MQKLGPSTRARNELLSAIEACCGALRGVEVAAALSAGQDEHRDQQFARAVELLRETISELRSLRGQSSKLAEAGFVVPTRSRMDRREPTR